MLLGSGATAPVLTALGPGPLRTRTLTERVPRYAPRTVYRHLARLGECGLVVRREEGGVPSVVSYSLSGPGRELYRLLRSYAASATAGDGEERVEDGGWTSLALLGEMWGSGWAAELASGPRSPTELSSLSAGMSFHQVNRRLHLLRLRGLLCESSHGGRGRRYKLTPQARRATALVAGLGRWRERLGLAGKREGLTAAETRTALRAALPLLRLPGHEGERIRLGIAGAGEENGGTEVLLVSCGSDGALRVGGGPEEQADAWAAGRVDVWLAALVEGNRGRMRVGGELGLVDACLAGLHRELWSPRPS